MKAKKLLAVSLVAALGAGAFVVSNAIADPAKEVKPADAQAQPQMQLPPEWTAEDMQACMVAAMPGQMHKHLAESVGEWESKNKMWMYPGAEPAVTTSTATITPMLDGRFIQCAMSGEWPGMGPYNGFALYGFDNVSQKFVSTWVDNCGTGMAHGTGELSDDDKTITWTFTYNCPINKKPTTLREVEHFTGKDSRKMEMYGIDPKSGKEFKMMEMVMTRKPGSDKTAAAAEGAGAGATPAAAAKNR